MNHPEINTETIKQRIRQEAMRSKAVPSEKKIEQGIEIFSSPESFIAPKIKETRYEFVNLSDLLPYGDEDFIRNAYRAILKREPDTDGFNDYLSRLRSGQLNKIEILGGISRSKEGREKNVRVKGLRLRYLANKSYKIPVAGYFIRLLTAIMNLPKIIKNVYSYQAFTDARLAGKADNETVEEVWSRLAGKADSETVEEVRSRLAGKADSEAVKELAATTENILRQISDQRLNTLDQQRRFILLLEEVKKSFPEPLSHEQMKTILKEEDHILDAMYMIFEDRFRGTRAGIKRRLGLYMPYIDKIKSEKGDLSLLDVGCGRGEWLELLQENGYRAKGIDINRVALLQCRELGLDVTESDVIEYLRGLERGSLDVIAGFHIIEHLSFKTLIALFDEALMVLKSGGMIIFETPNPANILVSSYDFYRDPGHKKPLHPDTINFVAESRGFVRTGSYFVLDEGADLKLIKSTEWMLSDINDYIKAPRDFALIGYKP